MLGCKLFVKEISSKAREQLINSSQSLVEGDVIAKINSTGCNDVMSLKEAKKIIDGSKDKLHLTVAKDLGVGAGLNVSHQTQSSVSTTGAVNNFYKGSRLTKTPHNLFLCSKHNDLFVLLTPLLIHPILFS